MVIEKRIVAWWGLLFGIKKIVNYFISRIGYNETRYRYLESDHSTSSFSISTVIFNSLNVFAPYCISLNCSNLFL